MLSKEHNQLVGRVGPGTPMGELMRQYWIPALLPSELAEPDGRPVRLRLLGENLIAFRATSGQAGVIRENCPHRGASLYFGRNEEEGIRCVYHGWKFDVAGHCVDMPNEPAESNFKDKVRAIAYPCQERGGVVWVYMGSRETPPSLPDLEPNMLPEAQVAPVMRDCNWLQALEGDIDTSHLGFLHLGSMKPEQMRPESFDYYTLKDRAPRYEVVDTDFGTMYGAYRPGREDTNYWRIASFLFPFYAMIPTGVLGLKVNVRAWVPLDDEHTMFWSMHTPGLFAGIFAGQEMANGYMADAHYLPNSSDRLGRWRLKQTRENDYLIDPEDQRSNTFTGIPGIHEQDQAITESMGTLMDRTQEHLGTADVMVIRTRQRLIKAATALRDEGLTPPGVDDPEVYRTRSGCAFIPTDANWLEATAELRKAFVEHPELEALAQSSGF